MCAPGARRGRQVRLSKQFGAMLGRETRKAKDVQFVDLTADDEEYVDKPALLSVSKPAPFTQARLCKSNLGEAESKTSVKDGLFLNYIEMLFKTESFCTLS